MKSLPNHEEIIGFLGLTSLGAASFLPNTQPQLDRRDEKDELYGFVGNSWGFGVSYGIESLYGGDKDSAFVPKNPMALRWKLTPIGSVTAHQTSGVQPVRVASLGTSFSATDEWEKWEVNSNNIDSYLTKTLQQDFNDRISKVNKLYNTTATSDKYKAKVRYIDIDSRSAGQRFCEPGANYDDQVSTDTHFDKIYLLNLNYSWQVTG